VTGLIEKGLLGELVARTLVLMARDFAAPRKNPGGRDLLKPVCLLDFLDTLFGNCEWCNKRTRSKFIQAFEKTYVNFTHWIVTRDRLPAEPSEYVQLMVMPVPIQLLNCFA